LAVTPVALAVLPAPPPPEAVLAEPVDAAEPAADVGVVEPADLLLLLQAGAKAASAARVPATTVTFKRKDIDITPEIMDDAPFGNLKLL
jgi:hypothetical protein